MPTLTQGTAMGGGASGHATVLVVEDEDQPGTLFESVLSQAYTVERATAGGDALSLLEDSIDVALLDRQMADISGDQVLGTTDSSGIDCRIAMVTAIDLDFDVIECVSRRLPAFP